MSEQELNKKLGEWAGWVFDVHAEYDYDYKHGYGLWFAPNGESCDFVGHIKPPDFTQSLDNCFKWLVSKLRSFSISVIKANDREWIFIVSSNGKIEQGCSDNPALALCLAIEKLIDSETK